MKFGRMPRGRDPRVPHLSALIAGLKLPPAPDVDYTGGLSNFGVMLNDRLGDCPSAAFYHSKQTMSYASTGVMVTEPDSCVLDLYERACGYNPGNPLTDQGGSEQVVLTYLSAFGALLSNGSREKLLGFVEVDPRNIDDVFRTVFDCGGVYTGFIVPQWLADAVQNDDALPPVWKEIGPASSESHAIWCPGFRRADGVIRFISWGDVYDMSVEFWAAFVDESYGLLSNDWIKNTGRTPAGMTMQQLEAAMAALGSVA